MIKKLVVIVYILTLYSCSNTKKKEQAPLIEIEKPKTTEIKYDLNEIDVVHIPDYKFKNVLIDRYLDFVQKDDLKSEYKGIVKSVAEYYKLNDGNLSFANAITYDKDGYMVEEQISSATYTYSYDANRNLIKEVKSSEGDINYVLTMQYNKKNQLVKCNKKYFDEDSNQFDWFVTIYYDLEDRPYLIENNHPIKKYSYRKELKYDGNRVTIYKVKNGNSHKAIEMIFSENNQVLKESDRYFTSFDFFNNAGLTSKRIVFENQKYKRTITYEYNTKGDVVRDVVLNYQNPTEIIENIIYKYDGFENITYEKYSYNHKNDVLEQFYEFEYYE